MAIFRGVGGSGDSSDNSFLQEVTAQATTATTKANEASASATTASTKADEALASANSAASSVASLQNNSISSAAFNTGDGVLTLTKLGGATVTADLDGRFLTSETDPVFTSHVAHGITATNISQWDTAYGWGDHSTQGYITNITTQSDPKYLSAIGDDTTTGTITAAGLSASGNVVSSGTCQANLLVSTGNTNVAGTLTVIENYNSLNGNINLSNGSITLGGTVDGRNVSTDGDKLDLIEANATADQTGAEIKTAYEAEADTNAFTDAEKTKLSNIETSADVTDTVNVTAAGALMDSEVTNLAQVKAFDSSDYATAAQGSTADSALQNLVEDTSPQLGGQLDGNSNSITNIGSITASTGTFSTVTGAIVTTSGNIEATGGNITAGGNIVVGGTVDGVDIAARDAVLTSTTTTANSAYGWGNHANANYLTTHQDISGKANLSGATFTGNVNIADNDELIFGGSNDLKISHSSSTNSSTIREGGTGSLFIQGENLFLTNTSSAKYLFGISGGATSLYYNGIEKLATSNTGISVQGNISVTGTVDGVDIATLNSNAIVDGDFTSNGFMKRTGAGTYTVDTNSYLSSYGGTVNGSVTVSGTPPSGQGVLTAHYLKGNTTTGGATTPVLDLEKNVTGTNGSGRFIEFNTKSVVTGSIVTRGHLGLNQTSSNYTAFPYFSHGDGNCGLALALSGSSSFNAIIPASTTGGSTSSNINLGHQYSRWNGVYLKISPNVSSDREYKRDIEELSEEEKRVAVACKGLIRKYRMRDAYEEKGENARLHIGIVAQDLQDAFTAEGLDAHRYGMFCSDTWHQATVTTEDEDGNVTTSVEDFELVEHAPEGATDITEITRLSVRYEELLAFIISTT
jgi:hypothetical protein